MTGLRGALSVRVNDGPTDRNVTRYCRGLKFTKVAPGGHRSLTFEMTLPRGTFTDLGPEDRCYVYDARTARTIIEGYLENPTPVDGPEGQQYEISAMGGMALTNDESRALIYVDTDLGGWEHVKYGNGAPSSSGEQYNDGGTSTGMQVQLNPGQPINTGSVAAIDYRALERAGMQLAAVRTITTSGKIDADYRTRFWPLTGPVTNIGDPTQMSTTAFDQTQWIGGSIPAGATAALLELGRTGAATTVGDDTTFTRFTGLTVLGRRMDRSGVLLTTSAAHGSTAVSILASQVIEDLLGRLLTFCDTGTAQVDTTTFAITQLAYPGGVKAAGVLNDLAVFEPNFLWEILESLDSGKHRFNFRAWPTTPRYEVSVKDGWRQTGSDADLCNRILVSWNDIFGNPKITTVTAASLGLTGIGLPVDALGTRIKDADPATLPEGRGSDANATRIGGQILTEKIKPPKAGTVLVRRPIVDMLTGNTVMPWEIEPGYLCRVRETGDDLRITQVDYDDDTTSMLLTLGEPVLSTEQRLARLVRGAPAKLAGL